MSFLETASVLIGRLENTMVAAVFSGVNLLLMPGPVPFWHKVCEFILSVTVATLVGFICDDTSMSRGMSFAFVAMAALLARSVLTFVLGFGDYILVQRKAIYKKILDRLFPDKTQVDKTPPK